MKKPVTKADLQRKVKELEAQLVHQYHFATATIDRANIKKTLGSAVILELTFLGGTKVFEPVAIKDGLSDETIAAIKADLKRSYERTVEFKP
jgi:hypothetical protein